MGTNERQSPLSAGSEPNSSGQKREGQVLHWGGVGNGYLGNALFQDLLVDVKETSGKVVPLDGAGGGNRAFSRLYGTLVPPSSIVS